MAVGSSYNFMDYLNVYDVKKKKKIVIGVFEWIMNEI